MGTTVKLPAWYPRNHKTLWEGCGWMSILAGWWVRRHRGKRMKRWIKERQNILQTEQWTKLGWLIYIPWWYYMILPTLYQWGNCRPIEWDMCGFFLFRCSSVHGESTTRSPKKSSQPAVRHGKIYAENPPFKIDSSSGLSAGMQLHSDWGTPSNCF